MSVAEMARVIGKRGLLRTEGYNLYIEVEILDVKQAYGRTRYTVKPVAGRGTVNVEDIRVEIQDGV